MISPKKAKEYSDAFEQAKALTRKDGTFTYVTLAMKTPLGYDKIRGLVKDWLDDKLIETVDVKGDNCTRHFKVVDFDGKPRHTSASGFVIREKTAQGNMWAAMRGLKNFTPPEIAAHANTDAVQVSLDAAQRYCQNLTRAGYLRVVEKAAPGRRPARYMLINNTGPLPPKEKRVRVMFDPNTDDHVFIQEGFKS